MEVIAFIQENLKILFVGLLGFVILQILINTVNRSLGSFFLKTRIGKLLFIKTGFAKMIATIIIPLVLVALLIAFQQKYDFIQLGNKDNYNALVISILTLYGILYTFLQFTIGYALQNKYDKYWGQSVTKHLFLKYLGFNIVSSPIFIMLLFYSVTYPSLSKTIHSAANYLKIPSEFPQSFWEISIFSIYILYVYLFIKSLKMMKLFYDNLEKRNPWLEWSIQKAIAEKYQQIFEYSFKEKSDYFFNKLFKEVETLDKKEQTDMFMHVLNEVFSSEIIADGQSVIRKIFNQGKREFKYRPIYLHEFFNRLYDMIEKSNMELRLRDLLAIYRLHDSAVYRSIACLHMHREEVLDQLIRVYSKNNSWKNDRECTYFEVPSVLVNRISSLDDIEKIHQHVKTRIAFKDMHKAYWYNDTELKTYEKILLNSYEIYVRCLLKFYKDYVDDLERKHYSWFWGEHRSHDRTGIIDERTSDIIYDYIIRMECTEQNKKYMEFIAEKLNFKYKASIIFFHMLYTGPSWEWKREVLFFHRMINKIWVEESITDEHALEFVCHKIKNGDIGHRIDVELIRCISQQVGIKRLNKEIIDYCLKYISLAKLLKFIYIFSDYRHCPMNFFDFDFSSIKTAYGSDWKINFLEEMIETPALLRETFFSQGIVYFCKNFSFTTEHFFLVNDFRVFFIDPFFKLYESEFKDLIDNHFPGKGIIEFLVLHIADKEYKYLTEGTSAESFLERVNEIIRIENKPIGEYVESLVGQANECRNGSISKVKMDRIINRLEDKCC